MIHDNDNDEYEPANVWQMAFDIELDDDTALQAFIDSSIAVLNGITLTSVVLVA